MPRPAARTVVPDPTDRGRRSRLRRAATVLLVLGCWLVPTGTAVAEARAGVCGAGEGGAVTVVVDTTALGGGIETRCATGLTAASRGDDALAAAGFSWSPPTGQPGFVCRLDGRPSASESFDTDNRSDYTEACLNTPPADAYWTYWKSSGDGSWQYSDSGLTASRVTIGGFEGWSFSTGTRSAPGFSPIAATVEPAPPPPVTSTQPPVTAVPPPAAPPPASTSAAPPPVSSTAAATPRTASSSSSSSTSTSTSSDPVATSTAAPPTTDPASAGDQSTSSAADTGTAATATSAMSTAGRATTTSSSAAETSNPSTPSTQAAAPAATDGNGPPWAALGGVALILVVAAAGVVVARRRNQAAGPGDNGV